MQTSRLSAFLVILILPAGTTWAANTVSRFVVGAGGGNAVSPSYACAGTAGQSTVAGASSASLQVVAGFWNGLGVVVGIGDPGAGDVPKIYRLHQNLPNPLTAGTVIRFDVPEDGARIALRIYDLRGALVTVLARGPQSAGEQRVAWDGRDARGTRSAAGVYLYVLDTPKQRFVRKLTVLR